MAAIGPVTPRVHGNLQSGCLVGVFLLDLSRDDFQRAAGFCKRDAGFEQSQHLKQDWDLRTDSERNPSVNVR